MHTHTRMHTHTHTTKILRFQLAEIILFQLKGIIFAIFISEVSLVDEDNIYLCEFYSIYSIHPTKHTCRNKHKPPFLSGPNGSVTTEI